jgi:hypothetical protein
MVALEVDAGPVVPLPREDAAHPYATVGHRYPHLSPADVAPVWYYEEGRVQLHADLRALMERLDFEPYDVVIVTSSAQFEGLGSYLADLPRPTVLVESISLGGWSKGTPYAVLPSSPLQLVDVTIHELGHYMGLQHACGECGSDPSCCERCAFRDDVMSYCRRRPDTHPQRHDPVNVFSSCTRQQIQSGFLTAFRSESAKPQSPACNGE